MCIWYVFTVEAEFDTGLPRNHRDGTGLLVKLQSSPGPCTKRSRGVKWFVISPLAGKLFKSS